MNFIGYPCFSQFIGQDCGGDPLPPAPPGPYDRVIAANNGLVSYSTTYNSPTGNLVVRIAARNNAASMPGIAISFGGTPLTMATEECDGTVGAPVCALGVLKAGPTGTQNLVITCTGSAGFALVRIGDVASFQGAGSPIGFQDGQNGTTNLFDVTVTSQAAGAGDLAYVACWMSQDAYPVTQYYDAVEQWQSYQVTTGSELVVNGDFASDATWNKGRGWSITGGKGVHAGGFGPMNQVIASLTANTKYLLTWTVDSIDTVALPSWRVGGITQGIPPTYGAAGTYQQVATSPSGVTGFGVSSSDGSTVIDNISLKLVTGGMAGYFGRQVTPPSGAQVTVESSPTTAKGAVLVVELKGLVLP